MLDQDIGALQKSKLIPRHIFADLAFKAEDDIDNEEQIADFLDLRLPGNLSNGIRVQAKRFDAKEYKVEENVSFKDEKGIVVNKQCPVANFIRWRYNEGTDNAKGDKEREKLNRQVGLSSRETHKVSEFSSLNECRWNRTPRSSSGRMGRYRLSSGTRPLRSRLKRCTEPSALLSTKNSACSRARSAPR